MAGLLLAVQASQENSVKRLQLGDLLISLGIIDALQLQAALGHHRQWGVPLGRAVLEKGFCSPEQLLQALSTQSGIPAIQVDPRELDPRLTSLIPVKVAEQHRAIPLRVEGKREEVLVIAIAAPASLAALDAVRSVSNKQRVVAQLASDTDIERAIRVLYKGADPFALMAPKPAAPPEPTGVSNREAEFSFEDEPAAPKPGETEDEEPRRVLIYGWPEPAARALAMLLASNELYGKQATAEEVKRSTPLDVVIAPIPAMEALFPTEERPRGHYVAAGKVPETDLPRAQRLGAKGFVTAPIDTDLLIRSIRRCRKLADASMPNVA
jgi:type IV pilus assembly protein PilB